MAMPMAACSEYLSGIVRASLAGAQPGGSSWEYFTSEQGIWRGCVSEEAGILVNQIAKEFVPSLIPPGSDLLKRVNNGFRTRPPIGDLEY